MAYVFSEIVPWIGGALLAGFLLGLLFWWSRLWLARRREAPEHLRGLAGYEVEGAGETLTSQLEALQQENRRLESRLAALATAEQAAASARIRMKDLEDANADLRDRVIQLEAAIAGDGDGPSAEPGTGAAPPDASALEDANAALDHASSRLAELTEELERMRRRNRELETRNSVLVGQFEAGVAPRDIPADAMAPSGGDTHQESTVHDPDTARSVLGFVPVADDLEAVEGIGPKIAGLCRELGIVTWRALADTDPDRLREMLAEAGPRFRAHDPETWPAQARLLAENRWQELKALTSNL